MQLNMVVHHVSMSVFIYTLFKLTEVKLSMQGYTFFLIFAPKKIVGTRYNRIGKAVLKSTHDLCFGSKIRKKVKLLTPF